MMQNGCDNRPAVKVIVNPMTRKVMSLDLLILCDSGHTKPCSSGFRDGTF